MKFINESYGDSYEPLGCNAVTKHIRFFGKWAIFRCNMYENGALYNCHLYVLVSLLFGAKVFNYLSNLNLINNTVRQKKFIKAHFSILENVLYTLHDWHMYVYA